MVIGKRLSVGVDPWCFAWSFELHTKCCIPELMISIWPFYIRIHLGKGNE